MSTADWRRDGSVTLSPLPSIVIGRRRCGDRRAPPGDEPVPPPKPPGMSHAAM